MRLTAISHPAVVAQNRAPYHELCGLGWEVTLVVPAAWRSDWGRVPLRPGPGLEFPGRLVPLPVRLSGSIPLHHYAPGALRKLLRASRPDLVYAEEEPYAWTTYQVGRAVSDLGLPFAYYSAQNIGKRYPPPFAARERWVLRRAALGVAVTDEVAEVLRAKRPDAPIATVPLWVAAEGLPPHAAADARRRLGTLGRFAVGYAGRLVPEKGLDTLLSAMEICGLPGAVLVIAGAGPLEAEVRRRVAGWGPEGPRAVMLGAVPHAQMAAVFAALDVLVLPSVDTPCWREQFGRVLVEAAAQGTAVMGSRSGWIPRLVAELGGLSFPQRDAAALAAGLRQCRAAWETPAWSEAAARRRAAADHYRVEHVARALDAAFRPLVHVPA